MTTDTSSPAYLWAQKQKKQDRENKAPLNAEIARQAYIISVIVQWLEKNQPDVFSRGLWDVLPSPVNEFLPVAHADCGVLNWYDGAFTKELLDLYAIRKNVK